MYFSLKKNSQYNEKLLVVCRFKNERHILFEFIHHYLEEGVDSFLLINDQSMDHYIEKNPWLNKLIKKNVIRIVTPNTPYFIKKFTKNRQLKISSMNPNLTLQEYEYNLYINYIKLFKWAIVVDSDEFMFSPNPKFKLKDILNKKLNIYDYIKIPGKIFKPIESQQPKSVINNNVITHSNYFDLECPNKSIKYIVKTKFIYELKVHTAILKNFYQISAQKLELSNVNNNIIQLNHYKYQSLDYLKKIKYFRGGGMNANRYKNLPKFKIEKNNYNKNCSILKNKRKNLIEKINSREQILPCYELYNKKIKFK